MARRLVLGNYASIPGFAGSGFGLRVSKPGQDAATATDDNLVFSSDWPAVLPIWKKDQFVVNPGTTNVGFPDIGYVPFAFFLIFPNAYTGAFSPILPSVWNAYASVKYFTNTGDSYLRLSASRNNVNAAYTLFSPSGDPQGWPTSWTVAYVIYRLPAG